MNTERIRHSSIDYIKSFAFICALFGLPLYALGNDAFFGLAAGVCVGAFAVFVTRFESEIDKVMRVLVPAAIVVAAVFVFGVPEWVRWLGLFLCITFSIAKIQEMIDDKEWRDIQRRIRERDGY